MQDKAAKSAARFTDACELFPPLQALLNVML